VNFVEASLADAIVLGVPLLLASTGELLVERAGVLNLGLEGMMLVGAATGFAVASATGSLTAGFCAAAGAGVLMALAHAFFCVTVKANQIVAGLTLGLLGVGLSSFIGSAYAGVPLAATLPSLKIPILGSLPVVGAILFNHDVMVYASLLLLPLVAVVLKRTRMGSAIRACGFAPAAADAAGISVIGVRYGTTIVGGALAGVAGAYFSCVYSRVWSDNLTAGRGWIALALVIFASWRPLWLLPGALLFGFVDALNFQLQARGVHVSADWLGMLPYVCTLLALFIVVIRRGGEDSTFPTALGTPYEREARA
jgi:ABC-type uncharacterized transport system permease subunit